LLKHADIAMYQAKKAGRNTLRFYDPEMQASIDKRAMLEADLQLAIAQQQLQLHYQVQVNIQHYPIGAEALIRWQHPKLGMVAPIEFIALAEETNLILPIGQWVLETACAQLKNWQSNPLTQHLVLSVNVSAKQFRQADFADSVINTVNQHGINPKRLMLEITESMLLDDIASIIVTMNTLKKIGLQFSLDDFGTGYSSLQYLKQLPLDQLKIDRSFVRDIEIDSNDRAIVRTIIAMAKSMNLEVIAEGVENQEQCTLLTKKGCKHFQGYLFGRPLDITAFNRTINQPS
jgi:EAL domain-containing protein (putative c-di-GMP-specific phosphodiesterase class I)